MISDASSDVFSDALSDVFSDALSDVFDGVSDMVSDASSDALSDAVSDVVSDMISDALSDALSDDMRSDVSAPVLSLGTLPVSPPHASACGSVDTAACRSQSVRLCTATASAALVHAGVPSRTLPASTHARISLVLLFITIPHICLFALSPRGEQHLLSI
jgi:hypothetical protein